MLVDFIIAGTQKGGTTALHEYLGGHPDIYMPKKKELHFFDSESHSFDYGNTDYTYYHSNFVKIKNHIKLGEATPIYMYWYTAPERMWHYNKDLRIILTLRNPIDRAYSHWNMEVKRGYESKSFSEAIRTESNRCREKLPFQHRIYSYIDRGYYSEQIKRLLFFFKQEQILALKSDDLIRNPNMQIRNVCKFISVSQMDNITLKTAHAREYSSLMSKNDREYLSNIYKHEIRTLEDMLGWDCSEWL